MSLQFSEASPPLSSCLSPQEQYRGTGSQGHASGRESARMAQGSLLLPRGEGLASRPHPRGVDGRGGWVGPRP